MGGMAAHAATIGELHRKADQAERWAEQRPVTLRLIPHRDRHGTWWTLGCDVCGKLAPLPIGAGSVAGPRSARWETLDRKPRLATRNRGRALDSLHRHAVAAHKGAPFSIDGPAA